MEKTLELTIHENCKRIIEKSTEYLKVISNPKFSKQFLFVCTKILPIDSNVKIYKNSVNEEVE